ncbi:MAG: type II toxin-antitoxin system HicA family toxin [Candidatus Komeilibacteria bacterium]|nr:type II toxin-antitoxin system HicA family toxin [Candidatus Komeilibacteria bacterium]
MPRLVPISPKRFIKLLLTLGFKNIRTKGSHHFFFNLKTGETTTIPIHGNENLSIGLIKEIMKDINLSLSDYENLRKKS